MRVRKVHLRARLERELSVSGELFTAILGECLAELFGELCHCRDECGIHSQGAVAAEGGPFRHRRCLAVTVHSWQVDQQGRATLAFNDRADRGPPGTDDQVALPMPRNGAVCGFRGTLGEHDVCGDMPLRSIPCSGSGLA